MYLHSRRLRSEEGAKEYVYLEGDMGALQRIRTQRRLLFDEKSGTHTSLMAL